MTSPDAAARRAQPSQEQSVRRRPDGHARACSRGRSERGACGAAEISTHAATRTSLSLFLRATNRPAPIANSDRGSPRRLGESAWFAATLSSSEPSNADPRPARGRTSPHEADRLVFGIDEVDTSARSDGLTTAPGRECETGRPSGARGGSRSHAPWEGRRMRCASHRRRFLHLAMRTAHEAHRQLMSLGYGRR